MKQMTTMSLTEETAKQIENFREQLEKKHRGKFSFTDAYLSKVADRFKKSDIAGILSEKVPSGRVGVCVYWKDRDVSTIENMSKEIELSEFVEKSWRFYK